MFMKKILFAIFIFAISISAKSQETIAYKDANSQLNGIKVMPTSVLTTGKKAGVLILPAWMGIDQHAKDVANELSKLGYIVFVADIYGEGNYPTNQKEAGEQAGFYKNNRDKYRRRIQLALDQLIIAGANPDQIAVIGYCFGGTGALETARSGMNVKAVVSFHGGLAADKNHMSDSITAKVLVCHGADDIFVSTEEQSDLRAEMKAANADWQMIYYSNAVHAFTDPAAGNDNSKGAAYNAMADKRSWEDMLQMFVEVFGL